MRGLQRAAVHLAIQGQLCSRPRCSPRGYGEIARPSSRLDVMFFSSPTVAMIQLNSIEVKIQCKL